MNLIPEILVLTADIRGTKYIQKPLHYGTPVVSNQKYLW